MYEQLLSDYQLIESSQGDVDRAVVTDADPEQIVDVVAAGGVAVPVDSRLGSDAKREVERRIASAAPLPDAAAVIVSSSGTGGSAKGVVLTHENLRSSAGAVCDRLAVGADDRWLVPLTLAHVAGLSTLWRAAHSRCALVFVAAGNSDEISSALESGSASIASVVPTQLARLVSRGIRPRGLRCLLVGGAPAPAGLIEAARALGYPVRRSYGMSEMASTVAIDGEPLADVRVEIIDGEIAVGGPQLSPADAWAPEPRRTARQLLLTGDAGELIDGRLVVLGRRDDVIIVGAENIHPAEIEGVLSSHPAVRLARVYAVDDAEYGAVLGAEVVVEADHDPDAVLSDLHDHCRARLPGIKLPRAIEIVDELPETLLGKVKRSPT